MRFRVWMVGVSVTLAVTGCAGKRVATTFTDLGKRVPAGTTVYVTTTDGKEVKGALATVVSVVDDRVAAGHVDPGFQ